MIHFFNEDLKSSCMITFTLSQPFKNMIEYLETKGCKITKVEAFILFDFFMHASGIVDDYDSSIASTENVNINGHHYYRTIFDIYDGSNIMRDELLKKENSDSSFIKFKEYYLKLNRPFSDDILYTVLSHFNVIYASLVDMLLQILDKINSDFKSFENTNYSSYSAIYSTSVNNNSVSISNDIEFDVHDGIIEGKKWYRVIYVSHIII